MGVGYSFAELNNEQFEDWGTVDAEAFMITGQLTGGDASAEKQSPYLTMHFYRTEQGVVLEDGQLVPAKQSGCLVQSQWNWSNSATSKKWSPPFQAYRYRRPVFITGEDDEYDNGFETTVSKSKLRGRGKALSLKISSEPGKDCQILGWDLQITGNK